ncbi:ABC transporter G family member 11-like [Micractinium conductrix]|uniref:ABC transporter G family member 11-like n=1 Tax=Micractinium conductrix TaxID=554055 RepID=A0A2P6VDH0_9CHLO|nr:ABC transporter G family member 11-like [Micractinium conductrix]|eukprot:PSC72150.1 ABC transporter G family member 11-like [Micractinium conductrix]
MSAPGVPDVEAPAAAGPAQTGSPVKQPPAGSHWDDVKANRKDVSSCLVRQEGTVTLSWSNLVVTVTDVKGNKRDILKGVDGYVEPNHMMAIMGPSGCGKTTLLDTLAGRLASSAQHTGDIRVNGHRSKLTYGRSAYVTQDDVLIGTLTVFETIFYAAKLRLPQGMPGEEKLKIVNDVISELGLESTRDTYIGTWHLRGVSGGQRRRVSIGCELVTSPQLIFLDEPTSGLDSAAAYYVMAAVRRLAEHCRTIISVIHQPSSEVFALFDKLCLLSDGYVVYFGAANRAIDFFAEAGLAVPTNRNPADHFLHVINPDFTDSDDVETNIQTLVKQYQASNIASHVRDHVKELEAAPGPVYAAGSAGQPSVVYQTSVLTYRTFLNNLRNVGVFWMRLAMYVMLCLGVAFVYFQLGNSWKDVFSRAALLFFVVAFLTFMSIAAFPAFIEDMKVFMRERLNGYYGVLTFTIANTLASLPFIFLISVVSTVCVYWIADLRGGGEYVIYFILNLFLALVTVESLMMAIAPLVPHYLMGIAAGAGMMGLFMICCGFFQPLSSMPKPIFRYPLSYLAYHTWSFTGFMQNEFKGTTGWGCPPGIDGLPQAGCPPLDGQAVLTYYDIMNVDKWVCLAILAGMAAFYRTLFFLVLKLKERKMT